jgi:hypothetical protein
VQAATAATPHPATAAPGAASASLSSAPSAAASPTAAPAPERTSPARPALASAPGGRGGAAPTASEIQLTQRVLADLQRQVELMLEVRLREALAPILARATDALVRDARKELTAAMRDIVSRSIARELGRREDR